MNGYLIPANASRGRLIWNFFRPIDLILVFTGGMITLVLILMFQKYMSDVWVSIGVLSPLLISAFLVIPIPNYHNILVFIISMYSFYKNRRKYYWRGWVSRGK